MFAFPVALYGALAVAFVLGMTGPATQHLLDPSPAADPLAEFILQDALERGVLDLEASASGHFMGESVALTLRNPSAKPMRVRVPAGTAFRPEDDGEQTLIAPFDQYLVLDGTAEQRLAFRAFCSEMGDTGPRAKGSMALGRSAQPLLDSLYGYLNRHTDLHQHEDVLQSAIWAITDGADLGAVFLDGNSEVEALRAWLSRLLGVENTWYGTILRTRMDAERRIVREALRVQGQLQLQRTEPTELRGYVLNSEGQVEWAFNRSTTLPAGRVRFRFELEVEGWEPGTYAVVYRSGEEELIRREFTL
jgi:hypothetical protein